MWTADPTPDAVLDAATRGTLIVPRSAISDDPFDPDEAEGFGSAFGGAFLRQNTLLSTIHEATDGDTETVEDLKSGKAENFNPYTYLRENFDEKTRNALLPAISRGEFEGAVSARMAKAIADDILYEDQLQRQENSSFLGALSGSVVTSLIDPTTYIPVVGATARLSRVGRIGLHALNAALSAGASEAVLQATQRNRSIQESLMGIGTAGVLGAGMGAFSVALGRSHPLHPENPNNPIRTENLTRQGEVIRTPDGYAKDDLSADELDDLRSLALNDSMGAARVAGTEMLAGRVARSEPKTALGRATRSLGDFFNSQTIVGRVVRGTSDTARAIGLRLMDPGGILLDLHLRGRSVAPSAEMLKKDYMTEADQLLGGMASRSFGLSAQLAQDAAYSGPKVAHEDVLKLTQRTLFGMEDKELESVLARKYGDDALDKLKQAAETNAADIHRLNAVWEKRLVKEGILQDKAKATMLKTERDKARAEIEQLTKQKADLQAQAKEKPVEGQPKVDNTAQIGQIDAQLAAARRRRDDFDQQHRAETSKAVPLGNDYGHAQMWNRDVIAENPAAFKSFLLDVLGVKPDVDWLRDRFELDADELEALKTTDPEKYREVLTEWAGDEHYVNLTRAEEALKSAEETHKQSLLDLNEALRGAGVLERDARNLTLKAARAKRDEFWSKLEAKRKRREVIAQELRATKNAFQVAHAQTRDRAALGPSPLEAKRDRANVQAGNAERNLATTIQDVLTDPATPPRAELNAGDVVQGMERVGAQNAKVSGLEQAIRQDVGNVSVDTARRQGKVNEIAMRLAQADKELAYLERRAQQLEDNLTAVTRSEEFVRVKRESLAEKVEGVKAIHGEAVKGLASAKRALLKARKSTPLEEMVGEIHRTMSNTGRLPSGIMDRVMAQSDRTTGRVKDRVLVLSKEQRIEAIRNGYLKDDLSQVLYGQYDQLASELALREAVGFGPGRQFSSWDEVRQLVSDDYDELIQAADAKSKPALRKEKQIMLDDLEEARNRIKGGFDDDGTSFGWARWISGKFRAANFIRYGSGFLASSLTDLAAMNLRHGNFATMISRYGRDAIEQMRTLKTESPSQFQAFISAMEMGMGAAASARRFGAEDLIHGAYSNYGIGHGRTRAITGTIDKGTEKLSGFVSTISGVPVWNRFWKTVSGIAMSHELRDMVTSYDKLSPAKIADLASLGIGRDEARRMAGFIEKHGVTKDGRFDPHLERWSDSEEGMLAARDFRIAIMRDMDRAINTPGIGDTPRLMSKWWVKALLQFQTFAFTGLNRTIYPMAQRIGLFRERQAFMSLGLLMLTATAVLVASDLRNGRDPSERFEEENLGKTIYDVIDRSGFLGWTSPYADSALKLTSGVTGYGGGSRYSRNNALSSMLGVNAALFNDIQSAAGAVANNDPNVINKLLVLAPFSAQARLFYNQVIKD